VTSFFELALRFLLFNTGALIKCTEFQNLFLFAVKCLGACQGERDSTRSALNFLSQLIGWRSIRISERAKAIMEQSPAALRMIDGCVLQYGDEIIQTCVRGLGGDIPQMLWPSISDCIYAVIQYSLVAAQQQQGLATTVETVHQWVYTAMLQWEINGVGSTAEARNDTTTNMKKKVVDMLFRFAAANVNKGGGASNNAAAGTKGKNMFKMLLTDFGKIAKGEMAIDSLLIYSL